MSEHNFSTIIGDKVSVQVYFDYTPEEAEVFDCPICPSELVIERVLVDDEDCMDILGGLSDECVDELSVRAELYLEVSNDPNEPD